MQGKQGVPLGGKAERRITQSGGVTMREYLFRGKSLEQGAGYTFDAHGNVLPLCEKGDWVFGMPVNRKRMDGANYMVIIPKIDGEHRWSMSVTIDPDTIGEYAGLTDQTGKRVFEGDILGWTDRYGLLRGIVRFGRYQNPVNDDGYSIGWHMEWIEGDEPHTRKELAYWIENGLRVCGNVHENFDLLKSTY